MIIPEDNAWTGIWGLATITFLSEDLVKKVKELIREGNVRRITILDKKSKEIIVVPLTIGVMGALLVPPLAAIGAIAALVTECTVRVERV